MRRTAKGLPGLYFFIITITAGMLSFIASGTPCFAETQWDVGISGNKDGIDGFHLSVGDYYHVPQRDVVVIRDRGVRDEELPVVFYLAQRAHVSPGVIVDLHLRGLSWMDVTLHYGLSPEIYYVPVTVVEGHHPHGHAYGYYKKHPKRTSWKSISLSDDDVVNQVNLKFISDRYGYSPDKVMKYRSEGRNFPVIDRDIKQEKHHKSGKKAGHGSGDKGKKDSKKSSSGKGKDKGDTQWKEGKHEGKGKK